jgi:hypothetical protein
MANLNNAASLNILSQLISGEISPEREEYEFNPYEYDQSYQVEFVEDEYEAQEYDPNQVISYSLNPCIEQEDEKLAKSFIRDLPYIYGEVLFTWRRDISELDLSYLQWIASLAWQAKSSELLSLVERLMIIINKY